MTHDPSLNLCRRQSFAKFHIVDLACCLTDTRAAAAFLARHKIPFEVAHRVLLHPDQRRSA